MPVKKGRMLITSIGTTVMSIKRFCKLVYKELDGINERLDALESKESKKDKIKTKDKEVK